MSRMSNHHVRLNETRTVSNEKEWNLCDHCGKKSKRTHRIEDAVWVCDSCLLDQIVKTN